MPKRVISEEEEESKVKLPKVEEESEEEESESDSSSDSDSSDSDSSDSSDSSSSESSGDDSSEQELEKKQKGNPVALPKPDIKGKKKVVEERKDLKHKRSDEESSRETAQQPERKKLKDQTNGHSNGHSNGAVTSSAAVLSWRETNRLTVVNLEDSSDNPIAPYTQFSDVPFPEYIKESIKSSKFKTPTPIQAQVWPLAIKGTDIIGIAETGSGKTLAFGYPAIMHIKNRTKKVAGPKALVLAPTRELAQQIHEVVNQACSFAGLTACCIYGGVAKTEQVRDVRKVDIIIATPGRLLDLLQEGSAKLDNVDYLVFDEADRMLDMGFIPQISKIVSALPDASTRQTLMFSATWPVDVQKFAHTYLRSPVQITIGGEKLSGAKQITQIIEVCANEHGKKPRLKKLLEQLCKDELPKILVFMLYKHTCDSLFYELQTAKWNVALLHGGLKQHERVRAVQQFKDGKSNILIATDVAARGLDIKDIKYVINVEMPLVMEDYVHRIGRTGRAGETGRAYTLFSPEDKVHARQLVRILEESKQNVPAELAKIAETAPVTKPRKSTMELLYGDFAKGADAEQMLKKPTKIIFD